MAGTFDNLVVALGREAAEKLVAGYGGIRIYVPVRAAPEGAFATLIGHAAAEALSRHYGGERLDMPIAKRAPRVLRGEICRLRREGMHVTAIARALGCTRRYVFRILADTRRAKRTGESPTCVFPVPAFPDPSPFQGEGEGPYQSCAAYPDQRMTLNFIASRAPPANPQSFATPARRARVASMAYPRGKLYQHRPIPRFPPRRSKIRRARDCARNVRPSRAANNGPHPRAPCALALSLTKGEGSEKTGRLCSG